MTEREILLKKISTYQFAILDLQIFLDTHPYDQQVLSQINECKEKLAAHKIKDVYDMEQKITWEAMIIVMEAVIALAHRYADLAESKAKECTDEKRKEELYTELRRLRKIREEKELKDCPFAH